jgi:PAS domain S-box-containing protein
LSENKTFSHLVVIGASASSIEALSELVSTLPQDFPAPIVIAQHLDPERVGDLEQILSRRSTLPVRTVSDHAPLEAGVISVVPSSHQVHITDHEIAFQTYQDVTARREAEEELRESEERLRQALEIETVGVLFFKADGSITDANEAFLRMSGYSREDLAGKLVRWDKMTPPEWMPDSLKAIEELRTTGRTTPYEKEYIRKDGSRWWALFAAKRLGEDEGVEFVIDITERKRAEEERERLVAHELTARAQSEERRRLSRELHDRVAHDIALVHQSLELHEALKESDPEKAAVKMEVAKETVKRAFNATRNLSMELRQREVQRSLEAAISNLLHDLVPPTVTFELSVDGDETPVPAEARSQVFLILREAIRNALTHSGCHRLTVRSEILPEEITGYVEDDGGGFDAETLRAAARNGLRSMEERAALLGGTLTVSSVPGRGTTVRVTMPLGERDGG